ncbi:MAG: hypothetical protein JSU86_09250 [Phycisphaerales bacterium]|nr:MAG: hypothetical protein JSU86_09250 [Phycisphaerales bacterium]
MRAAFEHVVAAGLLMSYIGCTPLSSQHAHPTVWHDAEGHHWYREDDPAYGDLDCEDRLIQEMPYSAITPFAVVGGSCVGDGRRFVTVFKFGATLDRVVSFLKTQGIEVQNDEAGNIKLFDSVELRNALTSYLRIIDQRTNAIVSNIANVNTAERKGPRAAPPYRRRVVVIHDDGRASIEPDPSPFRLVWSPNDPSAITEGEYLGYVRYPNVDVYRENIDMTVAAGEYHAVRQILEKLYDGGNGT